MSKLVCHMGKYSRGNVFGLQKHNQRENQNYSNENIDLEKSDLNYDLANDQNIKYLNRIDEIIKKNRTNTDRAVRKDAVVFVDTVVGSDKEFFANLSDQEQRRFFEESYEYLKGTVGEGNIVSATVHMDEGNPHMHLSFVPINEDGSLSAKKMINRNFLREIQDTFPKHLQKKAFHIERGMENSLKKHLEPLEYKKEQIKQDQIKLTEKELEIENLTTQNLKKYKSIENVANGLSKVENHTQGVIGKLGSIKTESVLFKSNKVALSEQDYSVLMQLAKSGEAKLIENMQLKSKIGSLEQKLNRKSLDDEINAVKLERYDKMVREHEGLERSFKRVEKAIQNLDLIDVVNQEIGKIKNKEKSYDMSR